MWKKLHSDKEAKIVAGICMVPIIALLASLYFVTTKYTEELLTVDNVIKSLELKNQAILQKAGSMSNELWQAQLAVLAVSMDVLRERKVSIGVRTIAWEKFTRSYLWVVQYDVQYPWNQKRVHDLLGASFLELSYPTQLALINELERRLEKAKNAGKKRAENRIQPKQDALEQEEIPSVSIKFLSITA